jgi:hypothetical protein
MCNQINGAKAVRKLGLKNDGYTDALLLSRGHYSDAVLSEL